MAPAPKRLDPILRTIFRGLVILCLALAALLAYLWFAPLGLRARTPDPANDYGEAAEAVGRLVASEGDQVNPLCQTRLLGHGERTAKAIVIFHGISNCPQQFAAIAENLHAGGYNVLLARLPHQGLADRLSNEPAQANAEEAIALAQEAADIAGGLGDEVIVVGMSGGGTLAAWLAQNHPGISRVVLVAPLFGVQNFPAALTRPISTAVNLLPNWWGWFDSVLQERAPGPQHAYPRFSSRTMAAYLRIASQVAEQARTTPPAAQDIRIVGNLNDESVRTEMYRAVAADWQAHGAEVFLYEFPITAGLKHDLIDPAQPDQQVEMVHPYVMAVIMADEPTEYEVR